MFRPTIGGSAAAGGRQSTAAAAASSSGSAASQNKQQAPQPPSSNDNAPSTIREIRSRTTGTTTSSSASNNARQLLANRRQAMSMERLNSNSASVNTNGSGNSSSATSTTTSSSMHNINNLNDKEKSSPINGSSNSINGSAASSPSRNSSTSSTAGLNRTASRVSRFRIAKAVFERLSSADSASDKPNRPTVSERPKGTVASRYAAAAAARGIAAQQANSNSNNTNTNSVTSPRSRMTSTTANKSPLRSQQQLDNKMTNSSTRSTAMNSSTNKSLATGRHDNQPRPQPRVIATTRKSPTSTTTTTSHQQDNSAQTQNNTIKSRSAGSTTSSTANGAKQSQHNNQPLVTGAATITATAKPPPRDLIDKIVLEIARDADKEHDANCTIQDLSNCDISGIPETLDFDKCFQDVEMMTEEEARKLLSRKSESSGSLFTSGDDHKSMPAVSANEPELLVSEDIIMRSNNHNVTFKASVNQNNNDDAESTLNQSAKSTDSLVPPSISSTSNSVTKARVRFSNEPVTVFDTHAIEDYDRRNDDIDPVAASAEYEIEKSRERDGIKLDGDDDDDDDDGDGDDDADGHDEKDREHNEGLEDDKSGAVILSERFTTNTTTPPISSNTTAKANYEVKSLGGGGGGDGGDDGGHRVDDGDFGSQRRVAAGAPHTHPGGTILGGSQHQPQFAQPLARQDIGLTNFSDTPDQRTGGQRAPVGLAAADNGGDDEDKARAQKEYIEFLEREVSLKQILEQNLRDLQSQYYETVKQLDGYKSSAEIKVAKFEQQLADANNRLEGVQNELSDAREQAGRFEKQLNDNKESSQLLEKKYHRAKRIIKDLQSREESFTKRELLYQQKLDEIEFELKELISSIDRTIYDDALKYFSISDSSHCLRQHQTRLDAFGLIRQMLNNFNSSKTSQSAQIKQRIATMLEQQLANMLAQSNNGTSVTAGPIIPVPPALPIGTGTNLSSDNNNLPLSSINTNNNNNNNDSKRHNQNHHNYASHRLSQPNMPHPIGVGGQPTKLFHGIGPTPIPTTNEPSPPQSVNSYPSSNSLNSLNMNNNNNNQQTVNNNIAGNNNKFRDLNLPPLGDSHKTLPTSSATDGNHQAFQPTAADTQAPYSTNEWHDKPVSEWTTNQVSTWLLALGLDQYISKFEDRNVNGQSLINLDSTVLKGLGVLNSNDRNLLKKKIRELRVEMEKERKIIEKKLKENLKSKTPASQAGGNSGGGGGGSAGGGGKQSWKKSLLS